MGWFTLAWSGFLFTAIGALISRAALALVLAACGLVAVQVGPAAAAPNIILISTDDHRADEIFGMDTVMSELVGKGTRFTNAYAPFPLCCPARASIMSGQHAHNHGVLSNTAPLGGYARFNRNSTLSTWIRAAGYQTAFVGKYINEYGSVKPVVVPPGWMDWHASVGGGHYFENRLRESRTGVAPVTNLYTGPYQTDLYTDIAVDIIERRIGSATPLFLWVSYFAPHQGRPVESDDPSIGTPAVAPRHRNDFAGTPLRGQEYDPSFNETDVSDKPLYIRNRQRLSSQLQAQMTESFQQRLESLLAVDEGIAEILEALQASGELGNTVIVFTSDNGYMMGEHRIHAGKTVPYEPSAQIPLIIRGPGFPAGVVRHQVTALIDLAPTFLELAGGTAGLPLDGMSLLPMAANPNFASARKLVVEAGPRGNSADDPWFYRGIRSQHWLYLEYEETNEVEMYDLANDPFQLRNVSADPGYSAARTWLAGLLDRLHDCSGSACH